MVILSWIIIGLALILLLGFSYWFIRKTKVQLAVLLGVSEILQRESEPVLEQVEKLQVTLVEKQAQMERAQADFNDHKD
ncbi:hypothetical protein PAF15_05145 [Weissella koreensis]|uniref:Uncharacterized protein n=1 Tax=Weissella koreensis TaxID=165096 RepID=A0A7H1MMY3_9LACO|nr:hypothetical protein [Weissella koreensis]AEJ24001.1 hypothetical protein WKK_05655 [Weissella koreensis KACC 15510]AVH75615.1 hypothetical protein C4597_06290 [Weissella koreensis]EJF34602.1 hypothetical protein JC2156_14420 [Weissella koreensis KCTC 3621]MCZ9311329.1 hypothetical protein [Weissella koreensis]QGN20838.1 hypothetical protein GKC51_06270 [Weissella koreensis]